MRQTSRAVAKAGVGIVTGKDEDAFYDDEWCRLKGYFFRLHIGIVEGVLHAGDVPPFTIKSIDPLASP